MSKKSKGMSARTSSHNLKRMTEPKVEKPKVDTLQGALRPSWEKRDSEENRA